MSIIRLTFLKFEPYISCKAYSKTSRNKTVRMRSLKDMQLKCREDPVVMKLDSPEFKNIFTPEVKELKSLFDKYQYEIRLAGGAVRDILMKQKPKDLDFATIATPQQMKDMFTQENVRMINMTGEKHGTITPRINDKENFEVTTLRVDMVTDGRHAQVEFTTDWKLDANRRDLTVNSMFLGFDGSVYDYFYGYEDLQNKKVAFVGDPEVRIKEDFLRIMRYFRFYGKIALEPDKHDPDTLEVIKQNAEGLQDVSGERIWTELKKMLEGNFAGDLLKCIINLGIGPYIGIMNPNLEELDKLISRSQHLRPHPMTYLAASMNNLDDVTLLNQRLKFSAFDRDMTYFIVEHRGEKVGRRPLLPYEKLVLNTKTKQKDAVPYVREVLKYKGDEDLLHAFNNWEIPKFPITGQMLKNYEVPPGKMYGPIIAKLKDIWIDSNYRISAGDLVLLIPEVVDELEDMKKKKNTKQ